MHTHLSLCIYIYIYTYIHTYRDTYYICIYVYIMYVLRYTYIVHLHTTLHVIICRGRRRAGEPPGYYVCMYAYMYIDMV